MAEESKELGIHPVGQGFSSGEHILHAPGDGPTIIQGDALACLQRLPASTFHCAVTSPPYFQQRHYTDDPREIGRECSQFDYIESLVSVFRELRTVLHPTGTLFLNLGDKRDKGLMNLPHLVADALVCDGWIWVDTIIWHKPSPTPQSMKGWRWEDGKLKKGSGRCTSAHEYIFVMAKTKDYFWNSAEFVEPRVESEGFRNPRNVWTIAAQPTKLPHFAAFPEELVRRCLKTVSKHCCATCLAPYAPVVEVERVKRERPNDRTARHEAEGNSCGNTVAGVNTTVLDYLPTCKCLKKITQCNIIDPFGGIGRTVKVAHELGHHGTMIEISGEYCEYAREMVAKESKA